MRALASNPYEAAARERKAGAIAALLRDLGVPAGVVAVANTDARNKACAIAGQRLPISDETWQRVVELVDAAENRQPRPEPSDPFAFFPS